MIGEFEYLLLSSAAALGEGAYGAAVRDAIKEVTKRNVSIGAIYVTLDRLEAKGLVTTYMGEATAQRGGRAKRMIRVSPQGTQAARNFFETVMRASRGTSWVTES